MESFYWENSKKLQTNQQPSLKQYLKCAMQSENPHCPSASFTFSAKKKVRREPEDNVAWKQNYLNRNIC